MMLITEIALTLFAGIALVFYAADTLYYMYENERDKREKESEKEEDEEAEKIQKHIAETLYS